MTTDVWMGLVGGETVKGEGTRKAPEEEEEWMVLERN
jgi:hypothetical protein